MVILELIHASMCDFVVLHLLDKKPMLLWGFLVIHNNSADRIPSWRRWIIQISALSTFDGRIVAYHGFNG